MSKLKRERIATIVVTYNRKKLLGECIDTLLNQTYPLDAIYIIDNASTDGTLEYLIGKGLVDKPLYHNKEPLEAVKQISLPSFPDRVIEIHYVRMHENTGGAGGFHEGVRRGYEEGFNWLWLMDDDVEPGEKCLEELLSYKETSGCIHPRKFYMDGTPFYWEGYIDLMTGKRISLPDISFKNGKDFCCVNFGCFEGMLISKYVIEKIGFPDERFFVVYDDTIYGFLASLYTNVLYVKTAKMLKKINKEKEPLSDLFIYYSMRNFFFKSRLSE